MSNAINYTSSINIAGNLSITGTTTSFSDNIIILNYNPKNSCDTGLLLQRFNTDITDSNNYSGIIYSETNDEFIFGYSSDDTRGNLQVSNLIPIRIRGLNSGDTNTIGNIYTTNGNVGIGTTSPTAILDVNGYGKFSNLYSNNITSVSLSVSNLSSSSLVTNDFISTNLTVSNNLIVDGNLTVNGTTTTVNTETTILEDNLIVINSGPAGLADGGILVKRYISGTTGSSNYAGLFYKESTDEYTFALTDSDPGVSPITISDYLPIRAKSLTLETSGNLSASNADITNITIGNVHVNTLVSSANITANLITVGSILSTSQTVNNLLVSGGTLTATSNSNTIGSILTTGGNVGIGRVPLFNLDVNNTIRAQNFIIGATGGTYTAGSIYSDNNWGMLFRSPVQTPVIASFSFANFNDTKLLTIASTGNIGIGPTAPSYRLDVTGSIRATSGDITLGSLLVTNISNTALTTGTLRATTLITSANITASLVTAGTGLITNISNTALTSGTLRVTTLLTAANITANLVTAGTGLITNISNTNLTTGSIRINTTTVSAGVGSGGSLTVLGGAAISGNVFIGGNLVGNNIIPVIQSTSFSVALTDKNDLFLISGAATVSLLSASSAGSGFTVSFKKTADVNSQVTIVPSSSTIDGLSNYVLSTQNEIVTLVSNGTNWEVAYNRTPVFASVYSIPGTYSFTVPNPVRTVYVCVFGAGGGGGGGTGAGNSGNGGGGGGYCEGPISVTPGQTLTITVGEGGEAGSPGGSSSVNDLVATGGGAGGVNSSGTWGSNGAAGSGSGGVINRSGGVGGQAPSQTSGSGGGGGGAGDNGDGTAGSGTTGGAGSAGFGGASNTTVATNGTSVRVVSWFREGGSGGSGNLEGTSTPGNNGGFPGGGGSGSGGATTAGSGGDGAVVIFY